MAKGESFEIRPHIHQNRATILHQSGYSPTGICGSTIGVTGLCVETYSDCRHALVLFQNLVNCFSLFNIKIRASPACSRKNRLNCKDSKIDGLAH